MVTELDRAIQAEPDLAGLPGRFLFGIDDGRADISGLGADVGVHVVGESTAPCCSRAATPAYPTRDVRSSADAGRGSRLDSRVAAERPGG